MRKIGKVEFKTPYILAPMAGLMDCPLRLTYSEFGFAMTSMGAISADAVEATGGRLINLCGCPESTDGREGALMLQLIGSSPERMAAAGRRVQGRASVIDLNFGCPLAGFLQRGWGAALLADVRKAAAVVKAVVDAVQIPVTVKARLLSSKDAGPTVDFALACQDAGAAAFILHARTLQEGFRGSPHWNMLGQVKKSISIPLVGNGGVRGRDDARHLIDAQGCDLVMVGVAALRDPVAFTEDHAGRPDARQIFMERYLFHCRYRLAATWRAHMHFRHVVGQMERFVARDHGCGMQRSCV